MVGITIITASLVILLSAFNGIEKMIEKLYSDFDAPITIRSTEHKTFFENELDFKLLNAHHGVKNYSKAVEEIVVLKNEDNWSNAQLVGVDSTFLDIARFSNHMVDGFPGLSENGEYTTIIGASLLDKLGGYIPQSYGRESITIYGPKRNMKMSGGKNPFQTKTVIVAGRMNYNKEVNSEYIVAPLELSKELLGYSENEISAVYLGLEKGTDKHAIKEELQQKLGSQFKVKTNDEKNELIFQTSKTERLIVIVILVFIFILASFNLVASLTMLFVEKKEDITILQSMGANHSFIFRIFFLEGVLISSKGIVFGLLLGYGVCFLQMQLGLLEMPNSYGELFPIEIKLKDAGLILFLVTSLSLIASYFPVKMLLKRNGIHS